MKDFSLVYIPVGVPTFHLESAQDQFERSIKLLRSVDANAVCPDKMLLNLLFRMKFKQSNQLLQHIKVMLRSSHRGQKLRHIFKTQLILRLQIREMKLRQFLRIR